MIAASSRYFSLVYRSRGRLYLDATVYAVFAAVFLLSGGKEYGSVFLSFGAFVSLYFAFAVAREFGASFQPEVLSLVVRRCGRRGILAGALVSLSLHHLIMAGGVVLLALADSRVRQQATPVSLLFSCIHIILSAAIAGGVLLHFSGMFVPMRRSFRLKATIVGFILAACGLVSSFAGEFTESPTLVFLVRHGLPPLNPLLQNAMTPGFSPAQLAELGYGLLYAFVLFFLAFKRWQSLDLYPRTD